MKLLPNHLYHIYNQGNNQETLFYSTENYCYFLRLLQKFVSPVCDILAYCLMPNHFHFLINTNENSTKPRIVGGLEMSTLAFGFKTLQSSFAQAINKQENRSGSLFGQKTKAKCLEIMGSDDSYQGHYPTTAFHYVHQNPMKAGLVQKMEDWQFSSFSGYAGLSNESLCNKKLASQLLKLNQETFLRDSYLVINDKILIEFFE